MKRILRPTELSFVRLRLVVRRLTRSVHAISTVRSKPDSRCSCACSYSGVETISTKSLRLGYCTSATESQLLVGVADEDLVGAAHPQHLAAARFHHLHRGVAVLAVLARAARLGAVGLLLELQAG